MDNVNKKILNLGCGEKHIAGAVNIDWNSEHTPHKPDIIHNLNILPYPFPDNHFDTIFAHHILEHLDKPFDVMKELSRILKNEGTLHIKVPHFSRGFTHAEHCHGFDVTFPQYFSKNHINSGYYGIDFDLAYLRMKWHAFPELVKYYTSNKVVLLTLHFLSKILSFLANLSPVFCSRVWCFWVGGFEEIEFKLINKKALNRNALIT